MILDLFATGGMGADSSQAANVPEATLPQGNYSYRNGSQSAPVGSGSISYIKLVCLQEAIGDVWLRFTLNRSPVNTPGAVVQAIGVYAAYTVGSLTGYTSVIQVPDALITQLGAIGSGDLISVTVERDGTQVGDTYAHDFDIIGALADFEPSSAQPGQIAIMNFMTFRMLDYLCLHQCKISDKDIPKADRQAYISNALMKIYGLEDGIDDPWYDTTTSLVLTNNQADVSGLLLQGITVIFDDAVGARRLFYPQQDAAAFSDLGNDPYAMNVIKYYWMGRTIFFFVGSTAVPVGNVTLQYKSKPNQYTDATADDVINIPPEQNQLVMDEVVIQYLIHTKQMPVDVQERVSNLQGLYEAASASKAKKLEMGGAG